MSARVGLVWIAIVSVVTTAFEWAMRRERSALIERMGTFGSNYSDPVRVELSEQLRVVVELTWWGHLALTLGLAVGMVLFTLAVRDRRWIPWVACALFATSVVMTVVDRVLLSENLELAFGTGRKAFFAMRSVSITGAELLLVMAASSRLPWRLPRLALPIAEGLFALALTAFSVAAIFMPDTELSGGWDAMFAVWPFAGYGATGVLVVSCTWAALVKQPELATIAPATGKGTVLRLLAWSLVMRVALGVLGAVATAIGAARGFDVAGLVALFVGVTVLCAFGIGAALAAQLRWPEDTRSGNALRFALGGLTIVVLADVWVASAAIELLGLVAEAKSADSFWAMPSLSRIEELQTIVNWAGRFAQLVGLVVMLAIVSSLKRTARYLDDDDSSRRAERVTTLAATAAGAGIVLGLFAGIATSGALPVLLAGALIVLVAGIVFFVQFLRLTFTLARGLDAHTPLVAALVIASAASGCFLSHERGDAAGTCAARPGVCCGPDLCAVPSEVCLLACEPETTEPRCVPTDSLPLVECARFATTVACDGPEDCTGGNLCNAVIGDTASGARCMTLDLPPSGPALCHEDADCYEGMTCRVDERILPVYSTCR